MNIKNLQVPNGTNSVALISGACRVLTSSFIETSNVNPAVIYLRDSSAASNDYVLCISLAPGESTRDYFGKHGLRFESGIYVQYQTGQVRGVLQTVMEEEFQTYMEELKAVVNIASAGL